MNKKFRNRSRYHQDLDDIILLIFIEAFTEKDMSLNKLSEASGLSYQTVKNLLNRETNYPRFHTLYRLAEAVGCKINCSKAGRVRLKKAG